jgi:hypothetical protein
VGRQLGRRAVVADHLDPGAGEGDVAEAVVEVRVGVHGRGHRCGRQPVDGGPLPLADLGRPPGVDHEQPRVAADDRDVDVEEFEPGDPAPVGDLDEGGILGCAHRCEVSRRCVRPL